MRMVDDADCSPGTSGCGCRLSHLRSSGCAVVRAGFSQQPLRPLSCLAKYVSLGSVFRFDHRRPLPIECRRCHGLSFVWTPGFAGHVVPVDCPVAQGMARRALRAAAVWWVGGANALGGSFQVSGCRKTVTVKGE